MSKLTRTARLRLPAQSSFLSPPAVAAPRISKTANMSRASVNSLYSDAKQQLDRGRYADGAKLFDEVERQHPYSIWARRAQLLSAYSHYQRAIIPARSARRSDS